MLQGAASNVLFQSHASKILNPFLERNHAAIIEFYDSLCHKAQIGSAVSVLSSTSPVADDMRTLALQRKHSLDAHGVSALASVQQYVRTNYQEVLLVYQAAYQTPGSCHEPCIAIGPRTASLTLRRVKSDHQLHTQRTGHALQKSKSGDDAQTNVSLMTMIPQRLTSLVRNMYLAVRFMRALSP